MVSNAPFIGIVAIVAFLSTVSPAQQATAPAGIKPSVVQESLIAPGSVPFHMKALISERGDSSKTHVEIFWISPSKWRRNIQSEDFAQTLIVNGDKLMEQDSDDYFPVGLQTLVTAMVDPGPALNAFQPGDILLTKANGASKESGLVCYQNNSNMCVSSRYGLREVVGSSVRSVAFTDYRTFKGKRIARLLDTSQGPGSGLTAEITQLEELKNQDDHLFSIDQPTPKAKQIQTVSLPEPQFRALAAENREIIWPQVLDGATTGTARIYVAIDPSGAVREALPVHTDNERANESACRQIKTWKFNPAMKDGVAVQAESVLTFAMNTRAWGPAAPLNDAEVRKLASNLVEPAIRQGTAPAGTTYTLRAAIDSDGRLIEVIAGEGPPKLFQPCYEALKQWHFSPVLQNGEPRPYRAEIIFQVH